MKLKTLQAWKRACIVRDKNKCVLTGADGAIYRLEVHHLDDKSTHPQKARLRENGITLLRPLHRAYHKWEGGTRYPTTRKGFKKWIQSTEGKKIINKYKRKIKMENVNKEEWEKWLRYKQEQQKPQPKVNQHARRTKMDDDNDIAKTLLTIFVFIVGTIGVIIFMYKLIEVAGQKDINPYDRQKVEYRSYLDSIPQLSDQF